jgi:hypothetical protein
VRTAQRQVIEQKLHHRPEGVSPPTDATVIMAQAGGKIGQQNGVT